MSVDAEAAMQSLIALVEQQIGKPKMWPLSQFPKHHLGAGSMFESLIFHGAAKPIFEKLDG